VSSSPVCLDSVVIPLVWGPKILDVGCGFGRWGYLCTTNYWETHDAELGRIPEIVGIDGFLPNLRMIKNNGCYTQVVNALVPPLPFKSDTFDTVIMVELIEHLEERKAADVIAEAKRVARRRVILSTPNFPAFRPGHDTMTGFNNLEAHVSYWSRKQLRQFGFSLYGAGWRPNFRYWPGIVRRLRMLGLYNGRMKIGLNSLGFWFPVLAENVVGVWNKIKS
jgi:SAM-dependent methyltransferase